MMMTLDNRLFFFIFLSVSGVFYPSMGRANTAIASLDQVSGFVEVIAVKDKKILRGKEGLLLFVDDIVRTQVDGVCSIIFRDGSETRLFESTEFLISQSDELKTAERSFRRTILMKVGALWGKFVKGRQNTRIQTSNATIAVKGNVVRIKDDGQEATVSVVEGAVSVENAVSSIVLQAGQQLQPFRKSDHLKEKIMEIPYRLSLISEKYQLGWEDLQEGLFRIQIQMLDILHGNNIKRAGRVYLQSNYYNLALPEDVRLDHNGFARIPVKIQPPYAGDHQFDGKIIIWAVMDGANYNNVGEGSVLINMKMPSKRRHIQVDADSGRIVPKE